MSGKPVAVVTGGAGFIGSHMVDVFVDNGYAVRVIDNMVGGREANLAHHAGNPDVTLEKADIRDLKPGARLFEGVVHVTHFAGIGDIVPSIERPADYMDANVMGTVRVLEAARAAGVQKLVYAASSSCYGLAATPTREDHPIQPEYPYALSKYQGEQAAFHWHKVYGLPVNSIRIFNAYGIRSRTSGAYGAVFGVFLRQKLANAPFTVVGDGTQTRDFLYVRDVAEAFFAACTTAKAGEVWNLGAGKPQAVNRLVELLGGPVTYLPKRPGEPDCTFADISKIQRDLGWSPKISFEEGVGRIMANIDYWREAPLWDTASIAKATETWFKFMDKKDGARSGGMISGLSNTYQHKVKTAAELAKILGPMPREKKVIMCHGVFDVVHPGHLRHLIYAKSKADILVASLTADIHITKGVMRPHVPQDLRALNLAAFELVDYVIIDANDKPLENLRKIQPDFFAKGYEYNASGVHPKTQEEMDVMASFGGEIIFTPGDIVYSSSKLIEAEPPRLGLEKLLSLMDMSGIGFDDLKEVLAKFNLLTVHVVGDTIVDTFTQCAMIGGQTKTPTMSVLFQERKDYIGGAAVVAEHLRASGAHVVFSTVLGDDSLKDFVLEGLKKSGVETRAIIDHTRPTTNKNAIVAGGYRLLKVDTLDNRSISDDIQHKLADAVTNVKADAVVFSDFRHGIFNRRTIPPLIEAIPAAMFKVADSQVASRWGNITEFQGFDLITPNEREARFALADQDSGIRPLASRLYDAAACKLLIMKMGDRGVITCRSEDHEAVDSFFVVDSFVRQVVDAVGAGDALLAYATLSMLVVKNPVIATIIGSIAAALEVEADGNIPITQDKVLERIIAVEAEAHYQR